MTSAAAIAGDGSPIDSRDTSRPIPLTTTMPVSNQKRPPCVSMHGTVDTKPIPIDNKSVERNWK
jgi:hypothetical protein